MKAPILALALLFPLLAQAALPVGKPLSPLTLEGEAGGLVTGGPWKSESLKGKIVLLFYVDPDEKGSNKEIEVALGALPQGPEVVSVAIINLGATWLPNSVIASKLEESQKEHPRTTYVKDLNKTLVKAWGAGDDTYMVSLIGPDQTVLYSYDGTMGQPQINEMIGKLKEAVLALTGKPIDSLGK
ncbi:MAG: hypothetical protein A2600_02655 [Candidatus Lambdaproteobacteria bacterium RIFOXYD1_FULL_56_27]|uniref:Transcriptional regulator n=1 Tax=Candidatus Lambdaproteobacteria bacterium RIFOXYD2_FULL_56_26 TaxID=1817773 RepID=A0A1F6H2R4_9PROT|nr:MAG: hypothetical protein A2557_06720 [Candidatus Lambdaproteobacteria bacterium RIFOXYD2_FULL_56_26]OGH05301.1 MAG: hypothetical protein A2426_05045 [Candidatus Lambdaproteobacteria bacterium RIFOXYC1_FULL_56_13]OGH09142.1 MAG: hypothetical protein A2600_02655 [Candidatus Lambdaproteobacteria bacterium RIFOXYD1_FULL_56_27]